MEWVTVAEAARHAHVTERTVRRWVEAGSVQSVRVRVNGRVYRRVSLADVLTAERDTRIAAGRTGLVSTMSA